MDANTATRWLVAGFIGIGAGGIGQAAGNWLLALSTGWTAFWLVFIYYETH